MPRNKSIDRARQRVREICESAGIDADDLQSGSQRRRASTVRRRLAIELTRELGLSLAETARQLGVSTTAIWKIVERSSKSE